jgi:hypothetical protein
LHTDEYEISLGREIALCRKMLRKLQEALNRRERQYGMTTAAFLQSLEGTDPADRISLESWKQEYQELQNWQRRLSAYEEVLESLK